MYKAVQKFFALHHHVALPGIGNFSVETSPAQIDFTDRTVSPGKHTIIFSNEKLPAEKKFYDFLANEIHADDIKTIRLFTDFTSHLHQQLNNSGRVYFKGIGTLTQQSQNVLNFQPDVMPVYLPPVKAERTIRKNATHTVRVGEDEKTSEEMQLALNQPEKIKEEKWWIAAAVLGAIGIAAIVVYYVMNS